MNSTVSQAGLPHVGMATGQMSASERRGNVHEIEAIARELALPSAEVAELYAHVYSDLKSRAQVLDYLPVFVARRVRASYRPEQVPLAPSMSTSGTVAPDSTA